MSGEQVLASGTVVLFSHTGSGWKPSVSESSKSTLDLVSLRNKSTVIRAKLISNNEVQLECPVTPVKVYDANSDLFYWLNDGSKYWGLNFVDKTLAVIFSEKADQAVLANSSNGASSSSASAASPVAAANRKKPAIPPKGTAPTSPKSAVSPGPKKSWPQPGAGYSASASTNPTNSLVKKAAEAPIPASKSFGPTSGSGKIASAGQRSTTSFGNTSPVVASSWIKDQNKEDGASSSPSPLSTTSSSTTTTPVSKLQLSNRPGSGPSSPSRSAAEESPTVKSPKLKRPDSSTNVARKRATTTLHASDDAVLGGSTMTPKAKANKSQREKIIDEVIKTEEDYVDSLTLIREKYILPLKYAPRLGVSIFKPGDMEKMMYGLEPIFVLNTALLNDLKQKKRGKTLYDSCGHVLQSYAPSMKLYIDYVNKYDNTIKMFKDYEDTSPVFKAFMVATSEDPESQSRGLRDYWIMPVQRIPRYALLLNELLKHTADDHSDQAFIKQALSQVQEIATYINTRKKDYDSQEKVAHIQQRLNPKCQPIMRERRTYVTEGIIYIKNALFIPPKKPIKVKKNKPEPLPELLGLSEIEFFLMNDLILWAIKDPKHPYLNELGRVPIAELLECIEKPAYTVSFYENTSNYKAFSIRNVDHTEETAPVFYCSDPTAALNWVATIRDTYAKTASARAAELDRLAKANMAPLSR